MRRLVRALAVAACCGGLPLSGHAFSLLPMHPGSTLRLNPEFSTTPEVFGLSYRDAFGIAMTTWNQIGIGPIPDHNFFLTRNPIVAGGDACDQDGIQVARFSADKCGMAFGSALAVTFIESNGGIVQEIDMIFDESRAWDVYTGNLQPTPTGQTRFDFMRVAVHELGHAAGLDHPDEDGQSVAAIMNSHVSNTDAPTADDIAGARAIRWTPAGSSLATLTVVQGGSGSGRVTSAPAGVSCTDTCAAVFPVGSTVTLTAVPDAGSVFAGWSGSCNASGVVQVSANRSCTATFTLPQALPTDARLGSIGTRATVAAGALVYGGFTISGLAATKQNVFIVVRGPSLQTLGVTQDPLDLPGLRVFDAAGNDVLNNAAGGHGVTTCAAAHPVATLYRTTRQALDANDSCVSVSLGGGTYTFTIEPTAADTSGEVLFEVLYNAQPAPGQSASAALKTIGSRGTVAGNRTMYGGFTLAQQGLVMIAVRGPSLQTLGVSNTPLNRPGLRLFNAAGADLLTNTSGGNTVSACSDPTNSTALYYAVTRGQALDPNDSCIRQRTLAAGVYTFTINPSTAGTSGEVLFEVTFSH